MTNVWWTHLYYSRNRWKPWLYIQLKRILLRWTNPIYWLILQFGKSNSENSSLKVANFLHFHSCSTSKIMAMLRFVELLSLCSQHTLARLVLLCGHLRGWIPLQQIFEHSWFQSRIGEAITGIGFRSVWLSRPKKTPSAIIQLKKKIISRRHICQPQLFSTEPDLSNTGSYLETLFFELFYFSF